MARTNDATSGASVSTDPAALIEAYYDAGWTDGLPVVPPSEASIADMLRGAGLRGDEVLGEIAGRNTVVVADKVAINAVMAGCRPEYLPVVVAAVRGLCHPDFAYHGPASSTGGSAMVLIVNGPVAQRLGIATAIDCSRAPQPVASRYRRRRLIIATTTFSQAVLFALVHPWAAPRGPLIGRYRMLGKFPQAVIEVSLSYGLGLIACG